MGRRILLTGASIAGNALAWWLLREGNHVVVVERAPAFRDGGQNVDVRGAARTVLKRMGLEQAVDALGTGEKGVAFVDEAGEVFAEFDLESLGDDGPTAELEILRGDLARLFYDACRGRAEYRFGDSIAAVESAGDAAHVTFRSGREEAFDLVVVAEGVGSDTRDLVFPGENDPRWLDVLMGYFTIPKGAGDGDVARWYNAPGGRSVFLRPDQKGTTRAVLTRQGPTDGEQDLEPDEQKRFLMEEFAGAGWETDRVLAGLEASDDFYFDVLRQVRMPRWSRERVVLLGDAAWCVTPLGGAGATLAIVGAYVLAGELSRNGDHAAAFATYEAVLRPFVDRVQDVPKFGPRMAQPHSRWGVAFQRTVLGIVARPGIRQVVKPLFSSSADEFELPEYAVTPGA
ncbi:FAD-dependent monooxygenase [Longimicrobium sp.]|uniref:FAD-dependent monooxygenase n=1 Tax=Longimicrobium sp. TaxID=2029185 RepID=UPI003B3A5988